MPSTRTDDVYRPFDWFPMLSENTLFALQTSLRHDFGFIARLEKLDGERDLNAKVIDDGSGNEYVLKVFAASESLEFVEAEIAILRYLAERDLPTPCPVRTLTGDFCFPIKLDGRERTARLVSFIPGRMLAQLPVVDDQLWSDFGRCVGQFRNALADFDHPAIHRPFVWNLSHASQVITDSLSLIGDEYLRETLARIIAGHGKALAKLSEPLPTSIIHGDLNDWNVIAVPSIADDAVATAIGGVIDFGDMVFSDSINELAVAIAYSILDRPNPLSIACKIVAACHMEIPLTCDELKILWHRVRLRLALSVAMAARQQAADPGNEYLGISQAPIQRSLSELMNIPPGLAFMAFCQACQLAAPPQISAARKWLDENRANFLSPIRELNDRPPITMNWSIDSQLFDGDPANMHSAIESATLQALESCGNALGIGGWGEPRLVYQSDQFQSIVGNAPRTVHLGVDVIAPTGTEVIAPVDGTLHAVAVIDKPLDYGGVLVTRHEAESGIPVYLLYGHLDPESIRHLKPGDRVVAGKAIAVLGARDVNGGWLPHLHFQVLADDFGLATDFPGVCQADWQELWLSVCPNPAAVFGCDPEFVSNRPPQTSEVVAKRRSSIGKSVRLSYDRPLQIVRGWSQFLYDEFGRRYLDAYNNVPHVGHCHPKVVEAAVRQMRILNSNTRYASQLQNKFAERLTATMPAGLDTCFFLSSASEANELALRLARAATGGRDIIVNEHAYHGHTTSLIDISPYKHNGRGGDGPPDWVHAVPVPDPYRGLYRVNDPDAGIKYAQHVAQAIDLINQRSGRLAGFIAETCPSVAGQIIPPVTYLPAVYDLVRSAGALCIADEVQTGYGRMGDCFYAFESSDVTPDIVVLGKPIGNGHPLAAVVTTAEIANRFAETGMEFFSTFGGNHVSCAVGLAVLDVVRDEHLQAHARAVGEFLRKKLVEEIGGHSMVGDIRGRGLFWGIELVLDRNSLEPAVAAASWVKNQLRNQGILIGTDGPFDNVLKIRPPMPFDESNVYQLVEALAKTLASLVPPFGN